MVVRHEVPNTLLLSLDSLLSIDINFSDILNAPELGLLVLDACFVVDCSEEGESVV
jgi:hypothetical protein